MIDCESECTWLLVCQFMYVRVSLCVRVCMWVVTVHVSAFMYVSLSGCDVGMCISWGVV